VAFIKLWPAEGQKALLVAEIIERFREEFENVHTDAVAGQEHVGAMITATLRFSDAIPGKQERLESLRSVQSQAVLVSFGDCPELVVSVCVRSGSELFIDSPKALHGDARPLVERAAHALDYVLFRG
jgi:hypothetical protein